MFLKMVLSSLNYGVNMEIFFYEEKLVIVPVSKSCQRRMLVCDYGCQNLAEEKLFVTLAMSKSR